MPKKNENALRSTFIRDLRYLLRAGSRSAPRPLSGGRVLVTCLRVLLALAPTLSIPAIAEAQSATFDTRSVGYGLWGDPANGGVAGSTIPGNGGGTWTHSITGAQSNRLLVVTTAVEWGDGSATPTGAQLTEVTYGGQPLTHAGRSYAWSGTSGGFLKQVEVWYLLEAGIAARSGDAIQVTTAPNQVFTLQGVAMSFYNMAQTGPESIASFAANSAQSSTSLWLTYLSGAPWVVDVIGHGNANASPDREVTSGFNFTPEGGRIRAGEVTTGTSAAGSTMAASYGRATPADSIEISWTISNSNRVAHLAAAFAPVPVAYVVTPSANGVPAGSPVSISAQLVDAEGNPVAIAGVPVTWTKSNPNGSFSSIVTNTDDAGIAGVTLNTHTLAGTSTTVTATTTGNALIGGGTRTGTSTTITTLDLGTRGEYRSRQDGVWNNSATWDEWTGSAWVPASTFPSSTSLVSPAVLGTASSQKTATSGTTHTVSLPSGIEEGDLILVFWSDANGSGTAPGTPTGFTQLYSSSSGNRIRRAWYRIADGSESTTLEIAAGAERSAHTAYRIAAGSYSGVPVAGTANSANGSGPNPPGLTSGFGAVSTLWFAASHSAGNAPGSISAPANYTASLLMGHSGSNGNAHATMASAFRTTTSSSSEDPGAFSLGSNRQHAAFTVAVQGAARSTTIRTGHTVTVAADQTASEVNVFGTLHLDPGTQLDIDSGATLTVRENGTLRLPSGVTPASNGRIAGAGGFVLSSDASIEIGAATGITDEGTGASAGSVRNGGTRSFSPGAHYTYNGVVNQNLGLGFPTNLTGSLTVNNPGNTVTIPATDRSITSGALHLVAGTFATENGTNRLSMGNSPTDSNARIFRSGGSLTGTLQGSFRHAVVFQGGSMTTGGELSGLVGAITVDLADGSQVLSLDANRTVHSGLNLVTGIVSTGVHTLTVAGDQTGSVSGGSTDSHIEGNLARTIAPGVNSYNFPLGSSGRYTPASLAFTANSEARTVTGTTTHTDHPAVAASGISETSTVNRSWSFSASGAGTFSVNPTFNWAAADEDGDFDASTAVLGQYSEDAWVVPPPAVTGRTATSISASGLTGFSSFLVGNEDHVPNAGESNVMANPASGVVADDLDAATVTVIVRNAVGAPVPAGAPVHLAITGGLVGSGGLNSSGPWSTDADGEVTALLTSTVASDVEVTAYLGSDTSGEFIGTALVGFIPGSVSVAPTGSLLTASDATRVAAEETATVTVQLRDSFGNNIAQENVAVRFTTDLGLMNGDVGSHTVQTDGSGVATVTLSSDEAGLSTVTAEVDSGGLQAVVNPGNVQVAFTAGALSVGPNGSELARDGSGTLVANGVQDATITVQLRDAHGNERSDTGVDVRFSTNLGLLDGSASPVTIQSVGGVATVSITSLTVGSASVTAEVDAGGLQPLSNGSPVVVEFVRPFPDPVNSALTRGPASVPANGVATSLLTVTVMDSDGIPLGGLLEEDFVFADGGGAAIGDFTEVGGGVYTFTVSSTTVETVSITVGVEGVALGGFNAIEFTEVLPDVTASALTGAPATALANGVGRVRLTVTLRDADDVPIAGMVPGADFEFLNLGSSILDSFSEVAPGVYEVELSGTVDEVVAPGARVRGIELGTFAPIAFIAPFPDAVTSELVRGAGSVTANGVASSTLSIAVRDADGVPLTDLHEGDFHFADAGDATIGEFTEVGAGVYTFTTTNTTVETVSITVEVSGIGLGGFDAIDFTGQLADPAVSVLARTPSTALANGVSRAFLTVTLLDSDSVPVTGLASGDFIFADAGSASIGGFNEVGGGVYTFEVTNLVAESVALSITAGGPHLGTADPILFTAPIPDAENSTLSRAPATVTANGVSASILTLTVLDADSVPITGLVATDFAFADSGSSSVGSHHEVGGGVYTFEVSNAVEETITPGVAVAGSPLGSFDAIVFVDALDVTTSALPAWSIGVSGYPGSLDASGGTQPLTWQAVNAGDLPVGLALNGDGTFAGLPTSAGLFTFVVEVTDANGFTALDTLSITIHPAPLVTTDAFLPVGIVDESYAPVIIGVSGGAAPLSLAQTSGSLPPGITLDTESWELRGTPLTAGTFVFDLAVADASGASSTVEFTLTVLEPLTVTTTTLPLWTEGSGNFPGSLTAFGGRAPYVWSPVNPADLPPGLALNENGTFTGAPAAVGVYSFEVVVTDAHGSTATGVVSVTINPEIHPTAELRLTVETDVAEAALGDTIVVTVRIMNEGTGAAENVIVRDDQVAQVQQQVGSMMVTRLKRLAAEVDRGVLNIETGEWTIGLIEARSAATMTVRLVVVEP